MSSPQNVNDPWQPCAPGTLAQLAGKDRRRRRRRTLMEIGSAVVVSGVLLAAAIFGIASLRPTEPNFGGISCSVFRANATDFMAGRLDPVLAEQMQQHLAQCAECQQMWRQMSMPATSQASHQSAQSLGSECSCSACRRSYDKAWQQAKPVHTATDGLVAVAIRE